MIEKAPGRAEGREGVRGVLSGVLGVVAVICAAGWLISQLSIKIILCYMKEKGYTPPTDSELKACSRKVTKAMFTLSRKSKR